MTLRLKVPAENVKIITDVRFTLERPLTPNDWRSCPRISYNTTSLELITSINELVTSSSFSFIFMSGHGEVCSLRGMSLFSIGGRMISGASLTAPINGSAFSARVGVKGFSSPVRGTQTETVEPSLDQSIVTFRNPGPQPPTISRDVFFFIDCCHSAGIIKLPYSCYVDRGGRFIKLPTGISREDLGDVRLAALSSCDHNGISFSSPRGSPMINDLCSLIGCSGSLQELARDLPRGAVLAFMREEDLHDMTW